MFRRWRIRQAERTLARLVGQLRDEERVPSMNGFCHTAICDHLRGEIARTAKLLEQLREG
jgi:hypothetical protein